MRKIGQYTQTKGTKTYSAGRFYRICVYSIPGTRINFGATGEIVVGPRGFFELNSSELENDGFAITEFTVNISSTVDFDTVIDVIYEGEVVVNE